MADDDGAAAQAKRGELMSRRPDSSPPSPAESPGDEKPGVPGFRTWRGVYWFVFAVFVVVVVALAIFTRVYS